MMETKSAKTKLNPTTCETVRLLANINCSTCKFVDYPEEVLEDMPGYDCLWIFIESGYPDWKSGWCEKWEEK